MTFAKFSELYSSSDGKNTREIVLNVSVVLYICSPMEDQMGNAIVHLADTVSSERSVTLMPTNERLEDLAARFNLVPCTRHAFHSGERFDGHPCYVNTSQIRLVKQHRQKFWEIEFLDGRSLRVKTCPELPLSAS